MTWGSQSAMPGDKVSNPLDAGVWGYCRSLHKEKPREMLGLVDLPPMNGAGCDDMHATHAALVRLVCEGALVSGKARAVAGAGGMVEVSLRGGQAYARRVATASPAAAPRGSWSAVGCGSGSNRLWQQSTVAAVDCGSSRPPPPGT